MAWVGTMKAATAAMLLLALMVAAAAAARIPSDAADQPSGGTADAASSHAHHHGHHHSRDSRSPLTGLTQCVTICGTAVTTCLLNCYGPLTSGDPVALPVCLLGCTNQAMVCASSCSTDIVD